MRKPVLAILVIATLVALLAARIGADAVVLVMLPMAAGAWTVVIRPSLVDVVRGRRRPRLTDGAAILIGVAQAIAAESVAACLGDTLERVTGAGIDWNVVIEHVILAVMFGLMAAAPVLQLVRGVEEDAPLGPVAVSAIAALVAGLAIVLGWQLVEGAVKPTGYPSDAIPSLIVLPTLAILFGVAFPLWRRALTGQPLRLAEAWVQALYAAMAGCTALLVFGLVIWFARSSPDSGEICGGIYGLVTGLCWIVALRLRTVGWSGRTPRPGLALPAAALLAIVIPLSLAPAAIVYSTAGGWGALIAVPAFPVVGVIVAAILTFGGLGQGRKVARLHA